MFCIPLRQQRIKRRGEGRQFGECQPEGGVLGVECLIGLVRCAHGLQIGRQVGPFRSGQAERLRFVEPVHDSGQGRQRPVVEIGRGVDGAEQRGCIHRTGAGAIVGRRNRADIMGLPVQEVRVRDVAAGAGTVAERREGRIEDRFAALRGLGSGFGQLTIPCQHGVGQEVEFAHVGEQSIQHEGRRFIAAELVDDDVAGEIAQGGEAAIAAVGPGEAQATEAGDVNRIIAPVIEDRVEEGAIDIDRAWLMARTRNEKPLVNVRAVVTGRTSNPEVLRRIAKDLRAVEQHVAIGHQRQVGLVDALLLEIEDEARQRILIEDVRPRRQARRHLDGAATQDNSFRQRAQRPARREIVNEEILGEIEGDDFARGFHGFATRGCGTSTKNTGGACAAVEFQPGEADASRSVGISSRDTVRERAIEFSSCPHGLLRTCRVVGHDCPVQFLVDPARYQPRRLGEDRLAVLASDGVQKGGGSDVAAAVQPC